MPCSKFALLKPGYPTCILLAKDDSFEDAVSKAIDLAEDSEGYLPCSRFIMLKASCSTCNDICPARDK